uniref:Reverse transcriptase domain-containing protein n=2 Tax=Lygus hesperus TaxID=30085 RepID=A0A0K8TJ54_LYGHE
MLLRFGAHSNRLREAIALLVRTLANGVVEWNQVRAMLARRAVALDKCPGIRPIGVGELLQRICGKTMAFVTGDDLKEACGAEQLCAGQKAGIEGAIHAVTSMFNDEETEGLLLVDASNAFNAMSRPLALWNARLYWPRCSRFLFNTYRGFPLILFRQSDASLMSQEGTTQGDPLGMMMYAVGTLQLIKSLKRSQWRQNWYADDSACIGKLSMIREWFDLLQAEGPKWGYYPEPSKSFLVIKDGLEEESRALFGDLNVKIVYSHRFLGGVIGSPAQKKEYVREKVQKWVEHTEKFAVAAQDSPQAVHAAFTKSLQFEWAFTQRVIEGCSNEYLPLWEAIRKRLMPAITGREVSETEGNLMSLPARLGGLGISNPIDSAQAFRISQRSCELLSASIISGDPLNSNEYYIDVSSVLKGERALRQSIQIQRSAELMHELPLNQQRVLRRITGSSQWLSVLPTAADGFDLSATQFRDALSLRYAHTPQGLPMSCDGCGSPFDVSHALNCKKGGIVKRGHDDVRDVVAGIANLAWGSTVIEPVLRESANGHPALVGDIMVNGVWESGRPAFFDNRIVNADAASYLPQDWHQTARSAANAKHAKYDQAAEERRGSFTPLVCSCDGALEREFGVFIKRASYVLSEKWTRPFSEIAGWVKTKIQFAIIRAVSLRIRGARRKVRPLELEDGAAMPRTGD